MRSPDRVTFVIMNSAPPSGPGPGHGILRDHAKPIDCDLAAALEELLDVDYYGRDCNRPTGHVVIEALVWAIFAVAMVLALAACNA